ncbi:MAG: hypothetical protein JRG70_19710, partial [Deltaproteobacteria bacterium]|nr:hypothetical protein [Deltaproteobacteria bacterium]
KKHRAVIVTGVRTPFVKAFGKFLKLDSIELADIAVRSLLERTDLPYEEIDSIVWGGVILPALAPNIAREVALDLRLPPSVEGMTCTRACASGLQAVTLAASAIERGEADVVIAGGHRRWLGLHQQRAAQPASESGSCAGTSRVRQGRHACGLPGRPLADDANHGNPPENAENCGAHDG